MLMKRLVLAFISLSVAFSLPAHAQKTIRGTVTDAETGETLPTAHIRIVGTRSGTVTNIDGDYVLELETLPAVIAASFIGYNSQRIPVTEQSPFILNFKLTPNPVILEAIEVSAEDPAIRIMKEVIRRKKEWQSQFESYKVKAYTRFTLENDTTVVAVSESITDCYWSREKGGHESVLSMRHTNNVTRETFFAYSGYLPSLYDDTIHFGHFAKLQIDGPTHPDAFDIYDFRLAGIRKIDTTKVFDIAFAPKSGFQTGLSGTLSVLDSLYAMISVTAALNRTVSVPPSFKEVEKFDNALFPTPKKELSHLSFEQRFSNFEGDFWLPVWHRCEGEGKGKGPGMNFPPIKFTETCRLSDYSVNVSMPDSLFREEKSFDNVRTETVDFSGALTDGQKAAKEDNSYLAYDNTMIPLTKEEELAYGTIDSTTTMEKAYQATGPIGRYIRTSIKSREAAERESPEKKKEPSYKKVLKQLFNIDRFLFGCNRIEKAYIGYKYKQSILNRLSIDPLIKMSNINDRMQYFYGGEIEYLWGKNKAGFITIGSMTGTDLRYESNAYSSLTNTILYLIGKKDYFDYYWNDRRNAAAGYRFSTLPVEVSGGINIERHSSLKNDDKDNNEHDNPAVGEGRLRSLELTLAYGDEPLTIVPGGRKRIEFSVEHSSPDHLSSDFSFTRYRLTLDWKFNTLFRRGLMPNTLDVRLIGGTFSGELPVQRFGTIDGRFAGLSPFGALRSLEDAPLEGEQYCALFLEHNFRTLPFELLRFRWLAEKGAGIIFHGAAGRTWISDNRLAGMNYSPRYSDGFHSEIGLTINDLFGSFRIDITKRLDKRGMFIGFGKARRF